MTAKIYTHNAFHNCDSEPTEVEGYVGQLGDFVPADLDALLPIGGTCRDAECLCGPWCSLLAQLPDGRIVPVV